MPVPDFESFKVTGGEVSSATKFNNFVQATEDEFGDIDQDQVTGLAFQTFVPSWMASVTNPTLGNGTLTGRFVQIGKLTVATIILTAGSTTTFGSGTYSFGLPAALHSSYVNFTPVGVALLHDSPTAVHLGTPSFASTTSVEIRVGTSGSWTAVNPFTFGNGDQSQVSLFYEAA